jgi:hypothetical protein
LQGRLWSDGRQLPKSLLRYIKMLNELVTKLLGGEMNIKEKISQVYYELGKDIGEVELLVLLAKEGKEISRARERLGYHMEKYKRLRVISRGIQESRPKEEYLVEFNNNVLDLLNGYAEGIKRLKGILG